MDTQWGAPLTGAQMKALRDAGLPDGTYKAVTRTSAIAGSLKYADFSIAADFFLPHDSPAYTLAKAGWLDGRNVALWFGGDKAPDDWGGGRLLLCNGECISSAMVKGLDWKHGTAGQYDIIAYTRKAECDHTGPKVFINRSHEGNVACGDCQEFLDAPPKTETVTIAKMTEAEARQRFDLPDKALLADFDAGSWAILHQLGLIKPGPTRLERFWATRDTKDVYGPPCKAFQLIEEALNFEK